MRTPMKFQWKKRNTYRTEYVSTYPAEVWLIRRAELAEYKGWKLLRADNDGDPYRLIGTHRTLAQAQQAAEDWLPES